MSLLYHPLVQRWIFGCTSQHVKNELYKLLKSYPPNFNLGEKVAEDMLKYYGPVWRPREIVGKMNQRWNPDFETTGAFFEVKCGIEFGNIQEKMLAAAIKYSEIPQLTGKRMNILCIGSTEILAREKYHMIGNNCLSIVPVLEERGISFLGASSIFPPSYLKTLARH